MELVEELSRIQFRPGPYFEWEPDSDTVWYDPRRIETDRGKLVLLHEVAHALLGHRAVSDDARYSMGRAAWRIAQDLAAERRIAIDGQLVAQSLRKVRELGY